MDPSHIGVLLKHLEKQGDILSECQKSILQELRKLQVEEEMLMLKLYEVVSEHRTKQIKGNDNGSYALLEGCSGTINATNDQEQ